MGANSIFVFPLMFAVFYFIVIRPQVKKQKEHQRLLAAIKIGDQVVTRGGVIGRVTALQDSLVTLELQDKVRVRVLRSYIDATYAEATATAASTGVERAA